MKKVVLVTFLTGVFFSAYAQEAATDYAEFFYTSFGGGMDFFSNEYDFGLSASLIKSSMADIET
ncbi:MAG: hypothetical protein LBK61_08045 [Spirochaetaceae bacterium]|nr:hypothetical protein [Spirochaetaceae bacterium]